MVGHRILKKNRGTGTPDIFEMIAINVQLKNQYEGANVKFKIFPEGADVNTARPLATVWGKNEGGKASAEWAYRIDPDNIPKEKPKFIFTAESFGCANVKAGNITVKKAMPEFTELKWMYKDEKNNVNEAKKAELGMPVKMTADVKNLTDGGIVTFSCYLNDYKDLKKDYFAQVKSEVNGGKVEADWVVDLGKDVEKIKKDEKLEYVFVCSTEDVDSANSVKLPIVFMCVIELMIHPDEIKKDTKFILKSKDCGYSQEKTIKDDLDSSDDKLTLKFNEMKAGYKYSLEFQSEADSKPSVFIPETDFSYFIRLIKRRGKG